MRDASWSVMKTTTRHTHPVEGVAVASYDTPKGGRYHLRLQIPHDQIAGYSSECECAGHAELELSLPGLQELDLSSLRKQLEESYSPRKVDDILEAVQDAIDDEVIPMVLRRYIRKS